MFSPIWFSFWTLSQYPNQCREVQIDVVAVFLCVSVLPVRNKCVNCNECFYFVNV